MVRHPLEPARLALRRTLFRRQIRAVLAGRSQTLDLELGVRGFDPSEMLAEAVVRFEPQMAAIELLTSALGRSASTSKVIDGLGLRDPLVKRQSARIAGLLRMEAAVPWIAPLLWSRDASVRASAAHALGTIGGVRSADALVIAIQRLGPRSSLIIALARAAPDLYIEAILSARHPRAALQAAAAAAGLRGRRTAIAPLIAQSGVGSTRFRAAGTRALGWIGSPTAVPALIAALEQRDWRVRMSAAKALASIKSYSPGPELHSCLTDRNEKVRRAAGSALRRLSRLGNAPVLGS